MVLPFIEIEGLRRDFRASGETVQALRGVDLSVDEGETVGILGENGAGKTTLLRIISTLLTPTAGTVHVAGRNVMTEAREVREQMTVTFGGERGLYGRLTGIQNLEFFGVLRGLSRRDLKARIPEVMERVGLHDGVDRRVETYSKGMRQRLHLAAGWLIRAPLVLLDEPTVGLDPLEAERTRELLSELGQGGTTIVLTSHVLRDIEMLSDRIVMLRNGAKAYDLPVRAFMRQTDDVATVTVTCREEPSRLPLDRIGEIVATRRDGHDWVARVHVASWTPDTFTRLGELAGHAGVADIDVERTSLEDVYRVLAVDGDASS